MRKRILGLVLAMLPTPVVYGEDGVYLKVADVPADYAIQGEYSGIIDANQEKWGAQVIALGDGKYESAGYRLGLPGDGYEPGEEVRRIEFRTENGKVIAAKDEFTFEIKDKQLHVMDSSGQPLGKLTKIERVSPSMGSKPPAGAVVLFDGKNADAFQNGKLSPEGYLQADCTSKETFGDHFLHLEFLTPFKPKGRGQDRGNSGVYMQGRYELQVLDSFGLSGENNECGGIYSIAKPRVNMCYPPLTWQTYDIEFQSARYDAEGKKIKNARATILHNGIKIHEDLELKTGTPGKDPEGPGNGPLYLQGHGNPVVYRNIWVVKR
ncbi:MAG: DUF1080 domain-containing protein [Pirellulaceae bacterium]